jgi:ComF family protein
MLLDLLFPPRCAGCAKVDWHWCAVCQQAVDQIPFPPLPRLSAESPLAAVATTGIHEGKLQDAIWSLKYANAPALAEPLGQRMARRLAALDWTIDMLVPVPLHTRRLQERGYNQSQRLGEQMALLGNIPLIPQAIQRTVATRSQVGLTAPEREANLQAAFQAGPQIVAGQTLVLIDDVFTTGATLSACAQAARDAGAAQVFGLTITQARG